MIKTRFTSQEYLNNTGMVYKVTKKGDQFIHTMCEGELLYQIGYKPENIIGRTLHDFFPLEYAKEKNELLEQAWNGLSIEYENDINGLYYRCFLRPVFEKGKVVEIIGSCIDITDIKQQEEEARKKEALCQTVFSTMSDGIFIVEQNGKLTTLNENVEKMIGIKSGYINEIKDQLPLEFIKENGETLPYCEFPGIVTLYQGTSFENFVCGVMEKNTLKKWILVNSKPLKIGENDCHAALVSFSDITEYKVMERSIIQAMEEAEKANKAKSEFLSKMSHELRTPLNSIIGFSQLLEIDRSLNDEQLDFVKEIQNGGRHLLHLINELLDLPNVESGNLNISMDVVCIHSVLNECIRIIQPIALKKAIHINEVRNPAGKFFVTADPVRLKQIIINLLENAIKYNKRNGEVHIECHLIGEELAVHIMDTGIGIPAQEYSKVFEPFYRINGINANGTGIGLSLVKQLTNSMGGRVGVSSIENSGSDFWFTIPIARTRKENSIIDK